MFDIALIDAGRLEVAAERIDVEAIVRRAARDVAAARRAGSHPPDDGADGVYAMGDERRTWQVLTNLLTNALKYSHGDGPWRSSVTRSGHEVVIGVRDSGPGDRAEDQERIFDRFTRLPHDGRHAGERPRSLHRAQPGGGSGRHDHRRAPPRARGRPSGSRSRRRRRPTVRTLIIDDDPDHREVVRTLLERAGLGPVTEAADGRGGLAAVEAAAPELVLLDIDMPGPSGLDILHELVRLAPAARIVILSNFPRRLHGEKRGCAARRLRGEARPAA